MEPRSVPESEPELLVELREALASGDPLGVLARASTMLDLIDPRNRDPFAPERAGPEGLDGDGLIGSFIAVARPETSALLAALAHLTGADTTRARIKKELARRAAPLPAWLEHLDQAQAYRCVEMGHVLGDGDNVIVGVRLHRGHELSIVTYIDHNMGSLVKDGFVVARSLDDVISSMQSMSQDPDITFAELDLADAKARITEAISIGAMTLPRPETDTWPACRPLVEWVVRTLPPGGRGYEQPDWSDADAAALVDRFFTSQFGRPLDDEDHRSLLESVLWFGTDYGPGDPLRWSPVAIEIILADWIPRKIVADAAYLAKAPDLLRAFVRFCHDERGIRPALTSATLAAIDAEEPVYQRTIRSDRPQGPAALLAAMEQFRASRPGGNAFGDPDDPDIFDDPDVFDGPDDFDGLDDFDDRYDLPAMMLHSLAQEVGGEEALDTLDDRPLPDEELDWDAVAADIHERVQEVLTHCDRACDELFDRETRTACRRLLARAAAGDPAVFRRRARPETAAAAIVWVIGKANRLFTPYHGRLMVKDLMAHFGLHQGSVSQRASSLLKAAGLGPHWGGHVVLDPSDHLVSFRRRQIIERRDYYRAMQ